MYESVIEQNLREKQAMSSSPRRIRNKSMVSRTYLDTNMSVSFQDLVLEDQYHDCPVYWQRRNSSPYLLITKPSKPTSCSNVLDDFDSLTSRKKIARGRSSTKFNLIAKLKGLLNVKTAS